MHELLVLPGEAAKQERSAAALLPGEWPLGWPFEVMNFALRQAGLLLQPSPLVGKSLLDNIFDARGRRCPDLDQAAQGVAFWLDKLSAHSYPILPDLRPSCPVNRLK